MKDFLNFQVHLAESLLDFYSECLSRAYGVIMLVSESVSPSELLSELHVQISCERTTVQSIPCRHVQLLYIVVYDYVLKCIDFWTKPANRQLIASR